MDRMRIPHTEPPTANGHSANHQARAWRILIVEDDTDTAELMAQLLRHEGCTVRIAPDGPAALCAAEADRPEVILLDLGLPGMDGYEVARGPRGPKSDKRTPL